MPSVLAYTALLAQHWLVASPRYGYAMLISPFPPWSAFTLNGFQLRVNAVNIQR